MRVLPTVSVVVPAAVAVVVYPLKKLFALMFAFVSRLVRVDAVAADATPVPVGKPVNTGVSNVGVLLNTANPVPVSSVTSAASSADDSLPVIAGV